MNKVTSKSMTMYDVRKLKDPHVRLKLSESLNTKVLKCINTGTIEESLTIIRETVGELRCAYDTLVFFNTIEGLQNLIHKITETSRTYGRLDINTRKTKLIIISKENITRANLYVNYMRIERVPQYNYLGTISNESLDNTQENKCRIRKTKS
ncbi:unnamed protein product [Diabrotica balteata]|uniref:Uncharacterized protein n=1 Tax=Diabrotica balteata TaxID=107213 RepID=A0A9N9XFU1_DIABA|nr:unnamed protein product [Diabrotica balteata]